MQDNIYIDLTIFKDTNKILARVYSLKKQKLVVYSSIPVFMISKEDEVWYLALSLHHISNHIGINLSKQDNVFIHSNSRTFYKTLKTILNGKSNKKRNTAETKLVDILNLLNSKVASIHKVRWMPRKIRRIRRNLRAYR